jgi:hypothetical protein
VKDGDMRALEREYDQDGDYTAGARLVIARLRLKAGGVECHLSDPPDDWTSAWASAGGMVPFVKGDPYVPGPDGWEPMAGWTDGEDEPSFCWVGRVGDRWFYATGSHDYTGWDCQGGGIYVVMDDPAGLASHLTTDDVRRLLA